MNVFDTPAVNNLLYADQLPSVPFVWDQQNQRDTLLSIFIMIVVIMVIAYVMFKKS